MVEFAVFDGGFVLLSCLLRLRASATPALKSSFRNSFNENHIALT